jgi:hypothetical protein
MHSLLPCSLWSAKHKGKCKSTMEIFTAVETMNRQWKYSLHQSFQMASLNIMEGKGTKQGVVLLGYNITISFHHIIGPLQNLQKKQLCSTTETLFM